MMRKGRTRKEVRKRRRQSRKRRRRRSDTKTKREYKEEGGQPKTRHYIRS